MNMNDRIQRFIESHAVNPGPEGRLAPPPAESVPSAQELHSHLEADELAALQPASVDLGRHARKCSICHHPERLAIEQDFIRWRSPYGIAEDYKLRDPSSVYRHAHAFGLVEVLDRNLRAGLDNFIERAERTAVTPTAIVQAVRIRAHINGEGQWVNPTTTHRVVVSALPATPVSPEPALPETPSTELSENPNRNTSGLENDATR